MRAFFLSAVLAGLSLPVQAADIERACLSSERAAGNRVLCGCIQDAANLTLSPREQRMAAGFFKDPEKAQQVRSSDSRSSDAFWERYQAFGETASTFCAS